MHLQKAHEIKKKNSDMYKQLLLESTLVPEDSGEMLQTKSGPTSIHPEDKLKTFATQFQDYLELYTPLHPSTRTREVKAVTDVIAFGLGTTPVAALDGTLVSSLFQKSHQIGTTWIFQRKREYTHLLVSPKNLEKLQEGTSVYERKSRRLLSISV